MYNVKRLIYIDSSFHVSYTQYAYIGFRYSWWNTVYIHLRLRFTVSNVNQHRQVHTEISAFTCSDGQSTFFEQSPSFCDCRKQQITSANVGHSAVDVG